MASFVVFGASVLYADIRLECRTHAMRPYIGLHNYYSASYPGRIASLHTKAGIFTAPWRTSIR